MAFVTDPDLLAELKREESSTAWIRFQKKYGPLIWLRGSDYHLLPQEQEELVQNVMVAFSAAQGTFEYNPEKGHFRNYLRTVIQNCIFQILRARQRTSEQEEIQDNTAMDENDCLSREEREEEEWKAYIYNQAMSRLRGEVKPRKLQAFTMCRLQGKRPEQVARFQKVSVATVYNDCDDVFKRLKELVQELKNEEE